MTDSRDCVIGGLSKEISSICGFGESLKEINGIGGFGESSKGNDIEFNIFKVSH